jgi:small ligand-binding sensory domain FIST
MVTDSWARRFDVLKNVPALRSVLMRFAAAVSDAEAWDRATDAVVAELQRGLDGARADLVCLFVSPQHEAGWLDVAERVRRELPGALLLGCTARSVLGAGRELEESPGLAALAAALPGVSLHGFQLGASAPPELPGPDDAHVILLVDPFRADLDAWMPALDARFPRGSTLGGVASGAAQPGRNLLFLGEKATRAGAVGVVLAGDLAVDTVVAQGCRPVGPPLFVTGARENVLYELDGQRPLDVLQRIFAAASPAEQRLFAGSLFLGIELVPEQSRFESGDFLIRNLIGSDANTGALHVAALLEGHRVVQFHVRDGAAAAEDLERRLARSAAGAREPAAGALLFSCLGRGRGLFGQPDHDSGAFARALGPVPLAGFFCNGELGPVEGRTFLHGYTSAFGIFRPRGEAR